MSFRVTPHRQYELGQIYAQKHFAQGVQLQQQISSGFRINRPSDDPAAQKVILDQETILQRYSTQLTAIDTARTVLSEAQAQVQDAQQLMVKAKELALRARQTTEPSEMNVFVSQLDSVLKQLDTIANAQSNGQYLFGGTGNNSAPFTGIVEGNTSYLGSDSAAMISLSGHPDIPIFYSGQDVFQPTTSGGLSITGDTGIASGSGTSSGAARTTLIIRHTATTFSGTSGIQAGTSSADGDTILGASGTHQLTINDTSGTGASGTISLNGGPPVTFTSSDGDLLVTGPQGEKIYVNTQAITPGFSGTVDITASGTLSIDGGTTEVPIDFSANQTLTDSSRNIVQHFDTTQLVSTGTVTVEPAATANVFEAVRFLRDAIANRETLSSSELDAALERSLGNLDAASDHLLGVIGQQSVDLQHLDVLESRISTLQLNAQTLLSDVQSTDYATAITQLQEQQNLLQFTLQSISTLNNISLVDFLT